MLSLAKMLTLSSVAGAGSSYLCTAMLRFTRGLAELNLSRTGLTARSIGRVAECLQTMPNIYSTLRRLDLSFNAMRGEEIGVSFVV